MRANGSANGSWNGVAPRGRSAGRRPGAGAVPLPVPAAVDRAGTVAVARASGAGAPARTSGAGASVRTSDGDVASTVSAAGPGARLAACPARDGRRIGGSPEGSGRAGTSLNGPGAARRVPDGLDHVRRVPDGADRADPADRRPATRGADGRACRGVAPARGTTRSRGGRAGGVRRRRSRAERILVGLAVTLCSATVVVALGLLADAAAGLHADPYPRAGTVTVSGSELPAAPASVPSVHSVPPVPSAPGSP